MPLPKISRFPGETKSRTEIEYLRRPQAVVNSSKFQGFTEYCFRAGCSKSAIFAKGASGRRYAVSYENQSAIFERDEIFDRDEIFERYEVSRFPGETKSRTEIEYLRRSQAVVNSDEIRSPFWLGESSSNFSGETTVGSIEGKS